MREELAEAAVHEVPDVERGWAADFDLYEAPDSERTDRMYLERWHSAEVLEQPWQELVVMELAAVEVRRKGP